MKQNFAGINGNSHFSVKFSSFTIYLSLKGMRRLDEIPGLWSKIPCSSWGALETLTGRRDDNTGKVTL